MRIILLSRFKYPILSPDRVRLTSVVRIITKQSASTYGPCKRVFTQVNHLYPGRRIVRNLKKLVSIQIRIMDTSLSPKHNSQNAFQEKTAQ